MQINRLLPALAVTLLLAATAGPAKAGPSFQCNRGGLTLDEAAICASPYLSSLDRKLARLWKGLTALQRKQIRNVQRNWIYERGRCGANVSCIEDFYLYQISQLRQLQ